MAVLEKKSKLELRMDLKVPFNGKVRGYRPERHMHLISLNFRGFISVVSGYYFFNSALFLGCLSKFQGFLASNLKLFCSTGL